MIWGGLKYDHEEMEEDSPSSASEATPPASQRSLRKTPARNKRHFEEADNTGKEAKKRRSNGAKIENDPNFIQSAEGHLLILQVSVL